MTSSCPPNPGFCPAAVVFRRLDLKGGLAFE